MRIHLRITPRNAGEACFQKFTDNAVSKTIKHAAQGKEENMLKGLLCWLMRKDARALLFSGMGQKGEPS